MRKAVIISMIIVSMLICGCTNKNNQISYSQIVNLSLNFLNIEPYKNIQQFSSKNHASYITYEISTDSNYKESTIMIDTYQVKEKDYVRYLSIKKDVNNSIDQGDIAWYAVEKKKLIKCRSPFYYDDILKDMETVELSDEFGKQYYKDILEFSEESGSSVGIISYIELDMNDDGNNEDISYVSAPWIQGKDNNITLQINTINSKASIPFSEEIFLNAKGNQLPFTQVNILNAKTNGFHDILVETVYKKPGEFNCKVYSFDGNKYVANMSETSKIT